MARKTLYDIIDEYEISPTTAFSRVRHYYDDAEYYTDSSGYFTETLKAYIENHIFENLPIRKAGQINLSDLLQDIGLSHLSGTKSFDDLFLFIELLACCQDSMPSKQSPDYALGKEMFDEAFKCINEILTTTNHKLVGPKNKRIVIQTDPTMEEAIEKVSDEELCVLLYKYKRYDNTLDGKKQILRNILSTLAPEIQTAKKNGTKNRLHDVANRIDDIANNFNVRHNNTAGKDKNNYASNLTDAEQGYWYDALYEAILLFMLEKDFDKAKDKLQKLRAK